MKTQYDELKNYSKGYIHSNSTMTEYWIYLNGKRIEIDGKIATYLLFYLGWGFHRG